MSQSPARNRLHLVFSTKNRAPFIVPALRKPLFGCLAATLNNLDCAAIAIGGVSDHVHILFVLARTISLSDVVEEVKKSSSKWTKQQGEPRFYWQSGDGAFPVCVSIEDKVIAYIANQEEHHRTMSFQDEYRRFLRKNKMEWDERYVWDPHVHRGEVRFLLLQGADRLMPEIDPKLAEYGAGVLAARQGVELRLNTRVLAIEPRKVHLAEETIAASTIVLAAGNVLNPAVAGLQVEKDNHGRIVVDPTMRCPGRPEVWAQGDCAAIPGPDGNPYPSLAQHALREAKVLGRNILNLMDRRSLRPFTYHTLGMMGALGHGAGFGQLLKVRVSGFPAWLIRRAYYLLQMPGWGRRLRIMIDWTFALLFRPDFVKVGLDRETLFALLRTVEFGDDSERRLDVAQGDSTTSVACTRCIEKSRSRMQ